MDGIYSRISHWIRDMKANDVVVIDRQELAEKLDYSEMDREELEARCKNADVCVMLYQNGFRSVVKGRGVFIDYLKIKNPDAVAQLVKNAQIATGKKKQVELALKAALKNIEEVDEYGSQMAFNEDMILFEEMSKEELISVLKEMTK